MEFTIKLEMEDWLKFQKLIGKSVIKRSRNSGFDFARNIVLWLMIAFVLMSIISPESSFDWPTAVFITLLFSILVAINLYNYKRMRKAYYPDEKGSYLQEKTYRIGVKGIEIFSDNYESRMKWSHITKVERTEGLILLFVDNNAAYMFPESKVEDPDFLFSVICNKTLLQYSLKYTASRLAVD